MTEAQELKCDDDFQHFLNYAKLSSFDGPYTVNDLRLAFEAAWEPKTE